MHLLAYYYHWSFFDIMNLSIPKRKMWVNMIKLQIKAENKANGAGDEDDPELEESPKVGGKDYKESC